MEWCGRLVHLGSALRFWNWSEVGHTFGIKTPSGQCNEGNMSSLYKREELVSLFLFLMPSLENVPLMGPQRCNMRRLHQPPLFGFVGLF